MEKNIENCDFFIENERFKPLIMHYARRLKSKTALADLWAFLWELEATKDLPSDNYISVCIRNEFIRLSRLNVKQKFAELFDLPCYDNDRDFWLDIETAFKRLTSKENCTLRLHYMGGYSVSDIAKLSNISRQAVDKNRRRGLEKIRAFLGEKY